MTFSTRATRAGSALLVFGILVTMIPTGSGFVLAASNCPAPQPAGGGGGSNGGPLIAAALIGGGLLALSSGGAGAGWFGLAAIRRKKKKTKKQLTEDRLRWQFERLDRFTRPTDAGSNPAINH